MHKILPFLLFLLFYSVPALGQTADSYFHDGAKNYIASQLDQAIARVEQGLLQYPNDPKLNALIETLKKEKEQQQQQQQQQDQQNQQQQEQQQDQQQEQQDQQQQQDQEQDQQESEGESQQEADPQDAENQGEIPEGMTKEQAEKILQALAQKEKELLKDFKKKKSQGSAKNEKDW